MPTLHHSKQWHHCLRLHSQIQFLTEIIESKDKKVNRPREIKNKQKCTNVELEIQQIKIIKEDSENFTPLIRKSLVTSINPSLTNSTRGVSYREFWTPELHINVSWKPRSVFDMNHLIYMMCFKTV